MPQCLVLPKHTQGPDGLPQEKEMLGSIGRSMHEAGMIRDCLIRPCVYSATHGGKAKQHPVVLEAENTRFVGRAIGLVGSLWLFDPPVCDWLGETRDLFFIFIFFGHMYACWLHMYECFLFFLSTIFTLFCYIL
jgi:hypothetical protein